MRIHSPVVEGTKILGFTREAEWAGTGPPASALPTGIQPDAPMPPARGAAWVEWCIALLNSNEFVYVD